MARGPLTVFLFAFTACGAVVRIGLRGGGGAAAPDWLRALAVAANLALAAYAATSLALGAPTPLGAAAHVAGLAGAAAMLSVLARALAAAPRR